MLDQPEVQYLDEVVVGTEAAQEDIRRLDVTGDEIAAVRLVQRMADLSQHEDYALRRHRPESLDEALEADAVEQLHDVIEVSILGHAVVVDIDRVDRAERRGVARFTFEPPEGGRARPVRRAQQLAAYQLDGGQARQQAMSRPPDFPHAALTDLVDQLVAADLAGAFPPLGEGGP